MQFDFLNQKRESRTYTVSKLNREVRGLLEDNYEGIWVEAEVMEVSFARSGHVYFSLIDPGGNASVSAVMWKGVASRYGNRIKKGAGVRCHGRVTLYESRGSFQIVVDRVEEAGAGIKAEMLEKLKAKLKKEGLFASERKRPLPQYPRRIGVVTSRDGAALRDIVKVALRRFPALISLAHAQVQGASAPGEIVEAMERLARQSDIEVVIVGRGGGSAEDLDAFNAEEVVRAASACPVPVIAAVGHETDFTLLDLVADRRAATPSEAAEMVVPDREVLKEELLDTRQGLAKAARWRIGMERERISDLEGRLKAKDPRVSLKRGIEVISSASKVLSTWPERSLERSRMDLDVSHASLLTGLQSALAEARESFFGLTTKLNTLSPLASLERGYAVVRNSGDGTIIKESKEAPSGTELDVTLARGHLLCEVKESSDA